MRRWKTLALALAACVLTQTVASAQYMPTGYPQYGMTPNMYYGGGYAYPYAYPNAYGYAAPGYYNHSGYQYNPYAYMQSRPTYNHVAQRPAYSPSPVMSHSAPVAAPVYLRPVQTASPVAQNSHEPIVVDSAVPPESLAAPTPLNAPMTNPTTSPDGEVLHYDPSLPVPEAPPSHVVRSAPPGACQSCTPGEPCYGCPAGEPCHSCPPGVVCDPEGPCGPIDPPCHAPRARQPKFFLFGDYLYLGVRGADVPFAVPQDGETPLAVPVGEVAVADPDYSSAYRVGGAFRIGCNSLFTMSYFGYDTSTFARAEVEDPTLLRSLITHPNTQNAAADSFEAEATYDIGFRIVDMDFKHLLCCKPEYYIAYTLGGRYAHLDQDLLATFQILGETEVETHINFDGAGPRVGLEGEYVLKCGVFTYAKGFLSLLAGHFGASYEQRNIFGGQQAFLEVGDDRIVPITELELGGGWQSKGGKIRLSGGYYVTSWYNTMTTPGLIRGVQGNNFTTNEDNFRDTLTFDGILGRIEFRF